MLNSSHLCVFIAPSVKSRWWTRDFLVVLKNFRMILKGMYVASSLQENLEQRLNEGLLMKHFHSNTLVKTPSSLHGPIFYIHSQHGFPLLKVP